MRALITVVLTIFLATCSKGSPNESGDWYVVTKAQHDVAEGDVMAVESDGIRFITGKGTAVLLPVAWDDPQQTGQSEHGQVVVRRDGSGLAISLNDKEIIAARKANADETKTANKTMADRASDESICAKAITCCDEAMRALGATCNRAFELGEPPAVDKCEGFLGGMAEILKARGKRVSSCD